MLELCLIQMTCCYAQNYAGIIIASLLSSTAVQLASHTVETAMMASAEGMGLGNAYDKQKYSLVGHKYDFLR